MCKAGVVYKQDKRKAQHGSKQLSSIGGEVLEVYVSRANKVVYKRNGVPFYTSKQKPKYPLGVDSAFDTVDSEATKMAYTCSYNKKPAGIAGGKFASLAAAQTACVRKPQCTGVVEKSMLKRVAAQRKKRWQAMVGAKKKYEATKRLSLIHI